MQLINAAPALQETDELRADIFAMLAALLRNGPSSEMLDWLSELEPEQGDDGAMAKAWSALALAAQHINVQQAADEYQELFIGIGRGELMPFGSWYLTGSLMETPLVALRQDLAQLGYQRQQDVYEPEDHIAAQCEVMNLMISSGHGYGPQQTFWKRHIAPWASRFFKDLQQAKGAAFYSAVGLLGEAFAEQEDNYYLQLSPAALGTGADHNNNPGDLT